MSECRCATAEQAALCRRAGTRMNAELWALCRVSAKYRAFWDKQDWQNLSQVQATPALSGAERLRTCTHRGRSLKDAAGSPVKRFCSLG